MLSDLMYLHVSQRHCVIACIRFIAINFLQHNITYKCIGSSARVHANRDTPTLRVCVESYHPLMQLNHQQHSARTATATQTMGTVCWPPPSPRRRLLLMVAAVAAFDFEALGNDDAPGATL